MPLGLETLGRAVMRRARRGLYAGRDVGFGNKVSEDGGNKSRRMWKPNTHYKKLYSFILDGMIRFRVTTHALRCIDKAGGIDEYLLNTPDEKLNSDIGLNWKRMLEQMQEAKQLQLQHLAAEKVILPDQPEGEGEGGSQQSEGDAPLVDSIGVEGKTEEQFATSNER